MSDRCQNCGRIEIEYDVDSEWYTWQSCEKFKSEHETEFSKSNKGEKNGNS